MNDKEHLRYLCMIEDITDPKQADAEKKNIARELKDRIQELAFQNKEKAQRAAELIIANKELAYQNEEKCKRASELIIANKELTFQNKEKGKRAAELVIANKELAFQNEEKGKRAAELLIANKELIIANKAQGEFLVNISHELKTPLNVIFSAAQLFDMYCKSGSLDDKKDSIIKYIYSIKLNSYRLSKLINNIIDLSKIEAGFFKLSLSNNNIVEIVEGIVMSVTTLTESKGLNIIFDTDIEEKTIACDTEMIERMILNLISNAIKFSNVGDEIIVDVKDKNEFVEISVKDNGIGIKKEHLDMIFNRFKQVDKSLSRNTEGAGVGLSLVKSIIKLHGGSINVKSKFGKGSKFTVMLPSRQVLQENMIDNNKMISGDENIRVELSDIYMQIP
ncbi:sensor histidine kinase [Clostridium tagluense]|uniref:sensor histidine kinase n=1 Tax=Clostridium tagluense TaxID=360422 RepID=UPI001CF4ACF6|nr:HAMP domain-containing sensor histidine kinase [Clostridium tagluense]MCB2299732.1 HAMP domain-containing histidine kinase [Clostridium tagluense]